MVNCCYRVDDKCIRISPNIFVVKNQNGFNKALYEFKKPDEGGKYGDENNYSKEELRKMVDNYPKHYPCVINLNFIWEISKIEVEIINNTELEILNKCYNEFKKGQDSERIAILDIIDTLKVIDPYEQCVQYSSIEDGIKAHAETYSFNIESELFNQLTKEQQALWRKEIEQACISGGEAGVELATDPRYKEKLEVKEMEE